MVEDCCTPSKGPACGCFMGLYNAMERMLPQCALTDHDPLNIEGKPFIVMAPWTLCSGCNSIAVPSSFYLYRLPFPKSSIVGGLDYHPRLDYMTNKTPASMLSRILHCLLKNSSKDNPFECSPNDARFIPCSFPLFDSERKMVALVDRNEVQQIYNRTKPALGVGRFSRAVAH